jgi:uncharacterized protein YjbI with pentapeptide repeats
MANPEHVKIVRQGAAAIAEWRRQNPGVPFDLTRADLREANLSGANLNGANLSGARAIDASLPEARLRAANLMQADLSGALLVRADLTVANLFAALLVGADLTGASLVLASFFAADLTRAKLTRADLTNANFSSAVLSGTRFASARFGFTSLGDCDLSRTKGLSSVKHRGPSSIGIDTLIKSFLRARNNLGPELEGFFLGAGVPKQALAGLARIVRAVGHYSCFICYGQPDLEFATKLRDDLVARGVPCWLYALDATPGERTWTEIGRRRREADKMVVICSAAALIRDGALKEIEEQIDEEPDKMVPISRDSLWREPGFRVIRGRDLKPFLLDKNYADFSDESRHEDSLQRLLKALRRKAD